MKYIYIAIFALLAISCSHNKSVHFKEIRPPYKSISPTISKLLKLEGASLQAEIENLWIAAKQKGLPIIEVDTIYSDYLWLTLLYQDSTENKDISFEVFGIYSEYRLGDMKMHRLKNTNLYYRSYIIPNDLCFSYRFNINDTITGKSYSDIDNYNLDRIPKGDKLAYSYSVLDLRKNETDWNKKRYDNTNSSIDTFQYQSKILNNTRNIFVYLPPDYNSMKQGGYTTIYLFDSFIYLNRVEVPNILDNLIIEGKITPIIAVMIDNPSRSSRMTELPLNFKFKDAIISELLPTINKKYNVSTSPNDNIIGGISYGGLAAAFIGFYHPDKFGKILSQSGSFWRDTTLTDAFGNEVRNDWLINHFALEKKKSLKMFLDWGLQENMVLGSNRKMVRVLKEKGYEYNYIEFNGWHDWSNSRKTFPIGLRYLLGEK